jgi:hypothetical protein
VARLRDFQNPSDRGKVIAGVDVFKLTSLRVSPTYVSERFVRAVNAVGLRGLAFERV